MRIAPSLEPFVDRRGASRATGGAASDFARLFGDAIAEANRAQRAADQTAADMVADKAGTMETIVAVTKAEMSLRMVLSMRNRALEAFQEVLRLQV